MRDASMLDDGVSRFYMMVDYVPFAFVTWRN